MAVSEISLYEQYNKAKAKFLRLATAIVNQHQTDLKPRETVRIHGRPHSFIRQIPPDQVCLQPGELPGHHYTFIWDTKDGGKITPGYIPGAFVFGPGHLPLSRTSLSRRHAIDTTSEITGGTTHRQRLVEVCLHHGSMVRVAIGEKPTILDQTHDPFAGHLEVFAEDQPLVALPYQIQILNDFNTRLNSVP